MFKYLIFCILLCIIFKINIPLPKKSISTQSNFSLIEKHVYLPGHKTFQDVKVFIQGNKGKALSAGIHFNLLGAQVIMTTVNLTTFNYTKIKNTNITMMEYSMFRNGSLDRLIDECNKMHGGKYHPGIMGFPGIFVDDEIEWYVWSMRSLEFNV